MVEMAIEAITCKDEAIEFIINQVFQLYSNLLTEEARRPWCKIQKEQIDVPHWSTYSKSKSNMRKRVKGLDLPSWTV